MKPLYFHYGKRELRHAVGVFESWETEQKKLILQGRLGHRVAPVYTKLSTGDILRRVTEQKGHGTH